MPTPDPSPTAVPNPETTVTPAADSDIQLTDPEINPTTEESSEGNVETITPSPKPTLTPEASSEVEMANQEQAFSEEETPLDTIEPAPREPAAPSLLEHSWLRVQLQPEIKSPTDSGEPMGLTTGSKGSSPAQLAAERRRRVRPAGISGSVEAGTAFSATG